MGCWVVSLSWQSSLLLWDCFVFPMLLPEAGNFKTAAGGDFKTTGCRLFRGVMRDAEAFEVGDWGAGALVVLAGLR